MVEKQILKMKFFKIIEYWNIGIVFVWKNRLFNLAFVNLNELKMNWTRLKNLSHDHSRSWTKNQQKYEPDSWTELNWTEMIADLVHFFPSLKKKLKMEKPWKLPRSFQKHITITYTKLINRSITSVVIDPNLAR